MGGKPSSRSCHTTVCHGCLYFGVANVRPLAGEETRWFMVVPLLGGCAGKSRSGVDYPLYGRTLIDCGKFHCKLTNLGTLCGSGAEEGFANLTFLVRSANTWTWQGRGAFGPLPCRLRSLQLLRMRTRKGVGLWSPIPIEPRFLELGMQTHVGPLPERWVVLV